MCLWMYIIQLHDSTSIDTHQSKLVWDWSIQVMLSDLSLDEATVILSYLDHKSLSSMTLVDRQWNKYSTNDYTWNDVLKEHQPIISRFTGEILFQRDLGSKLPIRTQYIVWKQKIKEGNFWMSRYMLKSKSWRGIQDLLQMLLLLSAPLLMLCPVSFSFLLKCIYIGAAVIWIPLSVYLFVWNGTHFLFPYFVQCKIVGVDHEFLINHFNIPNISYITRRTRDGTNQCENTMRRYFMVMFGIFFLLRESFNIVYGFIICTLFIIFLYYQLVTHYGTFRRAHPNNNLNTLSVLWGFYGCFILVSAFTEAFFIKVIVVVYFHWYFNKLWPTVIDSAHK